MVAPSICSFPDLEIDPPVFRGGFWGPSASAVEDVIRSEEISTTCVGDDIVKLSIS